MQIKLEADQSLGEKLLRLETIEDIQNLLIEQELEFSLEEIEILRNCIAQAMEMTKDGELSEEALDSVAGGTHLAVFVDPNTGATTFSVSSGMIRKPIGYNPGQRIKIF